MNEKNFVKIILIAILQYHVNIAKKNVKLIMKIFMKKYKINVISKNEMINSSHNLRRELFNKQFLQLKNFKNNLFETTSISKNMKILFSKRIKRTLINFKNICIETKTYCAIRVKKINVILFSHENDKRHRRFFNFCFVFYCFFVATRTQSFFSNKKHLTKFTHDKNLLQFFQLRQTVTVLLKKVNFDEKLRKFIVSTKIINFLNK